MRRDSCPLIHIVPAISFTVQAYRGLATPFVVEVVVEDSSCNIPLDTFCFPHDIFTSISLGTWTRLALQELQLWIFGGFRARGASSSPSLTVQAHHMCTSETTQQHVLLQNTSGLIWTSTLRDLAPADFQRSDRSSVWCKEYISLDMMLHNRLRRFVLLILWRSKFFHKLHN